MVNMNNDNYSPEYLVALNNIAKVCHEANRAYCETLGDDTQVPWEKAPEWQQMSAINGTHLHLTKYASAEDSHKSWMKEKQEAGWVYGEVKNPELKTHPCMVPYHELPVEIQMKDHLFRGIVHSFKAVINPHRTSDDVSSQAENN